LEVYLNIAEFGPGVFGAKSAAQLHFRKHISNLTQYGAALLAAVLPNPYKLNASKPSNYVSNRSIDISDQVKSLGGSHYLKNILE